MGYIEFDEQFFDIVKREGSTLFTKVGKSKFPESMRALFALHIKINALKNATFEMIDTDNPYAFNALYRCLADHFLKFNYIYFRVSSEKTDSVGNEYYSVCGAKEAIDYASAIKMSQKLLGNNVSFSTDKILETLYPKAKGLSNQEIEEASNKFKYRNILRYLSKEIPDFFNTESNLLASIVPEFALLSAFVHGGPYADIEMQDYAGPKAIAECRRKAGVAFLISASTFLQAGIVICHEFPECMPVVQSVKNVIDNFFKEEEAP